MQLTECLQFYYITGMCIVFHMSHEYPYYLVGAMWAVMIRTIVKLDISL